MAPTCIEIDHTNIGGHKYNTPRNMYLAASTPSALSRTCVVASYADSVEYDVPAGPVCYQSQSQCCVDVHCPDKSCRPTCTQMSTLTGDLGCF